MVEEVVETNREELMARARRAYKGQYPDLTWEQVNDLWPDIAHIPASDEYPLGRAPEAAADPETEDDGEDAAVEPDAGSVGAGDETTSAAGSEDPPALAEDPGSADAPVTPAQHALKEEWVAYAVAQGASEEDAEAMTKAELIEAYS